MNTTRPDRHRVLLVGGGAREHAIAKALCRSNRVDLFAVAHNFNPGIQSLSKEFVFDHDERDLIGITEWALQKRIDFAVIGLEDPLVVGLPDALATNGIPTVGPCQEAARLETSKLFLRDLMQRHRIPGRIDYQYFTDPNSLESFLSRSDRQYALKPDGLTAGKGVRVMGVQLASKGEAIDYGRTVIEEKIGGVAGILVEERVIGDEFTLQAFVDGKNIVPMPLVRDFKRAYDGDKGPNTGSMGSYSQADGLLSFVSNQKRNDALGILKQVVLALRKANIAYRGFIYGQFCMTKQGPKLIEINARLGDPEGINALSVLETDFVDICRAINSGTLDKVNVRFSPKATVCKYITPPGYPDKPGEGEPLIVDSASIEALGVKIYYAKVKAGSCGGEVLTTASRTIALIGIADMVGEAEAMVAQALTHVHGKYHVRHDVGKDVNELPSSEGGSRVHDSSTKGRSLMSSHFRS